MFQKRTIFQYIRDRNIHRRKVLLAAKLKNKKDKLSFLFMKGCKMATPNKLLTCEREKDCCRYFKKMPLTDQIA